MSEKIVKEVDSRINAYSKSLEDTVFKARITAFGEYEGFNRGKPGELIRQASEKLNSKDCYYIKLSLKKEAGWDEFEFVSCSSKLLMILSRIDNKTYYGTQALQQFINLRKGQYSVAILESTKIPENILPTAPPTAKPKPTPTPAKTTPTPKPTPAEAVPKAIKEEVKPTPPETEELRLREFLTKTVLPAILSREELVKKICRVYTEVYGYRFRDSKIRVTDKDVELIIELTSTSSTWAKPEEVVNNLLKTHIAPRIDKWVKSKVPIRIRLMVNGKLGAEKARAT